jgi:hypothetical protein
VTEFKRRTHVRLPYDLRNTHPGKNYGIHGLDVTFGVIGPGGAIEFNCTFGVYLPTVSMTTFEAGKIFATLVGYHSPSPTYEDQILTHSKCDLIPGDGPCYYAGSGLRAMEWGKKIFSACGDKVPEDILWPMLEEEYHRVFEVLS